MLRTSTAASTLTANSHSAAVGVGVRGAGVWHTTAHRLESEWDCTGRSIIGLAPWTGDATMTDATGRIHIPCGQLRLWQDVHTECPYRIVCERPGTRERMMLSRQPVFSEFENRLGTA